MITIKEGIAYQTDRTKSIKYDNKYWKKIEKHKLQPEMNNKINEFRCDIVETRANMYDVLDIGCGNCEFIKMYNDKGNESKAYGYDIMGKSIEMLHDMHLYVSPWADIPDNIIAFTFWDSLEHFQEPSKILETLIN
jgi:2-polyprenyl-3-methyl-5-hydroxy-6-metoxy-1,4-benzoquinol methylase